MPRRNAGAQLPGTLKKGRIRNSKKRPSFLASPDWIIIADNTKKGNSEGSRTLTQREAAFDTAAEICFGRKRSAVVIITVAVHSRIILYLEIIFPITK